MNERIKKIAKDAGVLGDWGEDVLEGRFFITGNTKQMEKFAELIIRKAAQFVSGSAEVYTQAEQDACVRAAIGLKKYFGVSE